MLTTQSNRPNVKNGRATSKEAVPTNPTDRVIRIVDQLAVTMQNAIGEIREINENAKLLSLNARIEAARAGSSGAAFGVVAQEMQGLSSKTSVIADEMANKTRESISELVRIISGNVRGARLADIALTNIDLVDRNLYERTCDVRWWATDSSIVDALTNPTPATIEQAIHRMGVILNAYTVYYDLVLCDAHGNIIANGRPNNFRSIGRNESKAYWFTRAMTTRSGEEFAAQNPHPSPLVEQRSAAIYSATVRHGGDSHGHVLGVLGVVFNWEALSSAILNSDVFDPSEANKIKRLFLDKDGNTLAASRNISPDYRLPIQKFEKLFTQNKAYELDVIDGKQSCIAHALSPGFETYSTGWHSIIIQELE